jgi:hypothetical protein
LQVLTNQIMEKVLVKPLGMGRGPREPALDGPLIMLEDPAGGGHIDPFTGRGHHLIDPARRCFQILHRRPEAHAEFRVARLTPQILDGIGAIMEPIAHQRMDLPIGDLEVGTLRVRAPIPICLDDFRSSSSAFPLSPRLNLAMHVRFTRSMRGTTDRTIARTLRMALAGLSIRVHFGMQPLIDVPAYPTTPQQPDQQQFITQAEEN